MPTPGKLAEVEAKLSEIIAVIQNSGRTAPTEEMSDDANAVVNIADIIAKVAKIHDMIIDYDSETEEAIDELLSQPMAAALKEDLTKVGIEVGQYEFEKAQELIVSLIDKYEMIIDY